MITIVIADDEKVIRAGIKKILMSNLGDNFRFVEARNGREAYEICCRELPDVVITDIKMPEMMGVELMQKLHELPQRPAIIVLSGYDDFTYAKSAITNGAIAYVLKPADTKELIGAVNTALSAVRAEEKVKREETVKAIMRDGVAGSQLRGGADAFPDAVCCLDVCGAGGNTAVAELFSGRSYSVLDERKDFVSCLIDARDADALVPEGGRAAYIFALSSQSRNLNDLRRLRREAFTAMLQSFFARGGDYLQTPRSCGVYRFAAGCGDSQVFSEFDKRYEALVGMIDLLATDELKKAVAMLFNFDDVAEANRAEMLRYVYDKLVDNLFKRYARQGNEDPYLYLKSLMIENIYQVPCLSDFVVYVRDYAIYLVELLKSRQGKYPYITRAVAYISEHYAEDINMATVANYVSVNYTWFSEKFKEQLGMNFNEYLKRYRMEQAKRLLEKGTYRVYEVAEKTGFKYVKHFMKSFHDMYGMSAGEWTRLHSMP